MQGYRPSATTALFLLITACGDFTGPRILGDYRLILINNLLVPAASDGCGIPVLSGSLHFTQAGAVRTLVYQLDNGQHPFTLAGSVNLIDDRIEFTFKEGDNTWRVDGTRSDNRISLSYAAPCDGTITETFERQ